MPIYFGIIFFFAPFLQIFSEKQEKFCRIFVIVFVQKHKFTD